MKIPTQNASVRIEYIDIFRSFGILLMVMGHIGFGKKFDFFIHAFHMPMFFILSGYLFVHTKKSGLTFPALLRKKAATLLVPYATFGIAHYLLYALQYYLANGSIDTAPLLRLLWDNTDGLPITGALWFLTAMFFADVLFYLIDRFIPKDLPKAVIITFLAIFGNFAKTHLPFALPFALAPGLVGLGLYFMGYLLKKYESKKPFHFLSNLPWVPCLLLGAVTTVLIFKNGYINMRTGSYTRICLFWINALLSTIVGLNLARLVYPLLKKNFVGKWLTGIGKESIVYLCMNQVVILYAGQLVALFQLPTYLSQPLLLVISLLVLWAVSKLFSRTPLRILIGKW